MGKVRRFTFGRGGAWLVAVNSADRIVVWKINGAAVSSQEFEIPIKDGMTPINVSISPDGATVALGHTPGGLLLWDVASHLPVGKFKFTTQDSRISFSGDGNTLVGLDAGRVTKAAYADVGFEALRRHACRVANRELTETERFQHRGDEEVSPTCQDASQVVSKR